MARTRSFVDNRFQHSTDSTQILNGVTRIAKTHVNNNNVTTNRRTSLRLFNNSQFGAHLSSVNFSRKRQHSLQCLFTTPVLLSPCSDYFGLLSGIDLVATFARKRCSPCLANILLPSHCYSMQCHPCGTILRQNPFNLCFFSFSTTFYSHFVRSTFHTGLCTKHRYGFVHVCLMRAAFDFTHSPLKVCEFHRKPARRLRWAIAVCSAASVPTTTC